MGPKSLWTKHGRTRCFQWHISFFPTMVTLVRGGGGGAPKPSFHMLQYWPNGESVRVDRVDATVTCVELQQKCAELELKLEKNPEQHQEEQRMLLDVVRRVEAKAQQVLRGPVGAGVVGVQFSPQAFKW